MRFMEDAPSSDQPARSAALRGWDRSYLPLVPVMADIQIQVSRRAIIASSMAGVLPQAA